MAISKQRHRELMELAIKEMMLSKSDHKDKHDPKVGAVLVNSSGEVIEVAHRGELRKGDHAEFTLLERKKLDKPLTGAILYTTLEPCVERNPPKSGCTFRAINARVSKVVIGHLDPDISVSGVGVELLEAEKIVVEYFDKDLEEKIAYENRDYFKEREDLATQLKKKEIAFPTKPMDLELKNFELADFSEEAQQEMISRMDLPYKLGTTSYLSFMNQFGFIKIGRKGTTPKPTGLGLLMLGKNPQLHFPQSRIKFTIHREGQEPIINDFDGALVLMPDKVEKYLDLIFSTSIDREQFHRVELSDIPKKVLREVIINAIVHRNYELDGARIMVDVYDDRVEVSSPGIPKFPIEKFYEFTVPSVSRNQKITFIFNKMHLVEERGLGMKELKALKAAGNPPDFKIEHDFFITVIYREKKTTKKSDFVVDNTFEGLNDDEIKGYKYLHIQKRVSKKQYAENFKIDEKKAQRHLSKFKELKLVKQEGKGPSTMYVLVDKK
jgi:ATP-dependent DNA helicase RecG